MCKKSTFYNRVLWKKKSFVFEGEKATRYPGGTIFAFVAIR